MLMNTVIFKNPFIIWSGTHLHAVTESCESSKNKGP